MLYVLTKIPPIAGPHTFPVQVIADALIEDQFMEIRTDVSGAAVTAQMEQQIDEICQDYNRSFNDLHYMGDFNQQLKLREERTRRIAKVRDNKLNRYERSKAIHDDKVSSCLIVFTCCLGPDCHTVIKPEMKNLEFRKALHKLDKHYGVVVGGRTEWIEKPLEQDYHQQIQSQSRVSVESHLGSEDHS